MSTTTPDLDVGLVEPASIGLVGNVRSGDVAQGDTFDELVASIREKGVLVPLLIAHDPSAQEGDAPYVLIDGHRRRAAAIAAGLERVPVRVVEASNDTERRVTGLIANLRREGLSPVDEADAYAAILAEKGWTQKRLATALGVSASKVSDRLRLAKLPAPVREAISSGAVALGAVPNVEKVAAASAVIAEALVARAADEPDISGETVDLADDWQVTATLDSLVQDRRNGEDVPFIAAVDSYRVGARELPGLGLRPDDHPELASRWAAKREGLDDFTWIAISEQSSNLVDAARAFGCLIESGGRHYVTDEEWWAAQVEAGLAAWKPPARRASGPTGTGAGSSPATEEQERAAAVAQREQDRIEALAAGQRNEQLEQLLRVALAKPETVTPEAARLVAAAAIEQLDEGRLALVFAELHTVTVKGAADKQRAKTNLASREKVETWLRAWIDDAESAEQIIGRTAALLLAHFLADDRIMPRSGRPYFHSAPEVVRRVTAAVPAEVDPVLLDLFGERNRYSLERPGDVADPAAE